jgi:hypothetical protein
MKSQFLREHHSRQEKARKGDYRMEFSEQGASCSSSQTDRLLEKAKFRENAILHSRTWVFYYGQLRFRNGWSFQQFVGANQESLSQFQPKAADKLLAGLTTEDLRSIRNLMRHGEIRWRRDNGTMQMSLAMDFKSAGLQCDKISEGD